MYAPNYPGLRSPNCIKDVWCYNVHEEFRTIRQIVQQYCWVAMDTEFPGTVVQPVHVGLLKTHPEYNYQLMRLNVDLLKLIQLGLTFMDDHGRTPQGYCTWQFNFKFSVLRDCHASNSIDLLHRCGLNFRKHATHGIEPLEFAELLMTSGLVLMDNVKFLSFHSSYDYGYLIRLLTDLPLPLDEPDFFDILKIYFHNIYDVKHLMRQCKDLYGGLQDVADMLALPRIGVQHQAGSDSLLTGMAFFKIKDLFFDGDIEDTNGQVHGLGLTMQDKVVKGRSLFPLSRCSPIFPLPMCFPLLFPLPRWLKRMPVQTK